MSDLTDLLDSYVDGDLTRDELVKHLKAFEFKPVPAARTDAGQAAYIQDIDEAYADYPQPDTWGEVMTYTALPMEERLALNRAMQS